MHVSIVIVAHLISLKVKAGDSLGNKYLISMMGIALSHQYLCTVGNCHVNDINIYKVIHVYYLILGLIVYMEL